MNLLLSLAFNKKLNYGRNKWNNGLVVYDKLSIS